MLPQHRAAHDLRRQVHAQNVDSVREVVLRCSESRRFAGSCSAALLTFVGTGLLDETAPLNSIQQLTVVAPTVSEADATVCANLGGRLQSLSCAARNPLRPDCGSQPGTYYRLASVCVRWGSIR